MHLGNLSEGLKKLANWCHRTVGPEQLEIWYERIGHIPNEAWNDIIKKIIDRTKPNSPLPSPEEIRSAYSLWLQDHPLKKAIEFERQDCDECDGDGCITAWYEDEDIKGFFLDDEPRQIWYKKYLPCAKCDNWKRQFPVQGALAPKRRWTKDEIVEAGMYLQSPYVYRAPIKEEDIPF